MTAASDGVRHEITLVVNDRPVTIDVESRSLLVHVLREQLGLTGAHVGCVVGRCGACTVLLDGQPIKSCMMFAVQAAGGSLRTVESLAAGEDDLSDLQYAFWERDAAECGYCTPGMLMAATPLVERGRPATDEEIRHAISGNLCRCTGYQNIVDAVRAAAQQASGTAGADGSDPRPADEGR